MTSQEARTAAAPAVDLSAAKAAAWLSLTVFVALIVLYFVGLDQGATSVFGNTMPSFFTATNPQALSGDIDSNITSTLVPQGTDIPPPVGTPEPTTLLLAGVGLPLIGLGRDLRRKGQPVA